MRDEVWAWLPRDHEGRATPAAAELLYEAGGLARRLDAALVLVTDRKPDAQVNALVKTWGVNSVRNLKTEAAPHPEFDGAISPLYELEPANPPRAFLLAADTFGKVAAPHWAMESAAELVTWCTGVTTDSARYVAARSTLGGQYDALEYLPLDVPLVVTLAPGAVGSFNPPPAAKSKSGKDGANQKGDQGRWRIQPPDPGTLDIADAERIVAFGRGAFNDKALGLVEKLAERLGAAVAGTRPAADEGWLPFSRQIGLTGAIVRPRLYVAVGISGAPYHMVGIKDAETLVAINSDAEAPIFGGAHLGIVGDLHEVLPRLIGEIEAQGEWKAAGAGPPGGRGQ